MITFSVITVTYNAGAHCERTFHSVSEQTYPRVEHLIIDGASTDHTLQLARAYQEQQQDQLPDGATSEGEHHTVKIFSEPDNGLYDAMNKGIRQATGDYIVFLNAGDVFPLPSTLEQISDALAHALSRSHAPSLPSPPRQRVTLRAVPTATDSRQRLSGRHERSGTGRRIHNGMPHLRWITPGSYPAYAEHWKALSVGYMRQGSFL